MDADPAGAVAAIERDLISPPVNPTQSKDHVAQLQETVRHQQSQIDAQGVRLHRLETVLAQLSVSLAGPAATSARAAAAAASAPAAPAVAGAPTAVGTVSAQAKVTAAGTVAAAEWPPAGPWPMVEAPRLPGFVRRSHCWQTTSSCSHATCDHQL